MARNGPKASLLWGKKSTLFTMLSPRKGWVKKQVKLDLKKMFKPVTSKLDDVMGPSAVSNLPDGSLRSHAQKQPARRKKAIWKELIISPTSIHLKIWMLKVCLTKLFRPKLRNKFQRVLRQVMTK